MWGGRVGPGRTDVRRGAVTIISIPPGLVCVARGLRRAEHGDYHHPWCSLIPSGPFNAWATCCIIGPMWGQRWRVHSREAGFTSSRGLWQTERLEVIGRLPWLHEYFLFTITATAQLRLTLEV